MTVTGRVNVASNPPFRTPPPDAARLVFSRPLGRPSGRFKPPTALFDSAVAVLQYDSGDPGAFMPLGIAMPHAFGFVFSSAGFFDGGVGGR